MVETSTTCRPPLPAATAHDGTACLPLITAGMVQQPASTLAKAHVGEQRGRSRER